jgi:hypothetical protein
MFCLKKHKKIYLISIIFNLIKKKPPFPTSFVTYEYKHAVRLVIKKKQSKKAILF